MYILLLLSLSVVSRFTLFASSFSPSCSAFEGNAYAEMQASADADQADSAENRFIGPAGVSHRPLDLKSKRSRGRPEQEVTWFLVVGHAARLASSSTRNPGFSDFMINCQSLFHRIFKNLSRHTQINHTIFLPFSLTNVYVLNCHCFEIY